MSQHQVDFKIAGQRYVDALVVVKNARRELDRATAELDRAERAAAEARASLSKYVGPAILSRAVALPDGLILLVEHGEKSPTCRVWNSNDDNEEVR